MNVAVYISGDEGKHRAYEEQVHGSQSWQGAQVDRDSKEASSVEDCERCDVSNRGQIRH
jgi:hypothetical protein